MPFFSNESSLFLQQVLQSFGSDVAIDDNVLDSFLEKTKSSNLSREQKLVWLASQLNTADGWEAASSIFEYALRGATADERLGLFAVYSGAASDQVEINCSLPKNVRARIADEAISVCWRALESNPFNVATACTLASIYLRHPNLIDLQEFYLEQSLRWYRLAEEWNLGQDESERLLAPAIGIGRCLFAMKKWHDALIVFEKIDQAILAESEDEETLNDVRMKIDMCNHHLDGNSNF